MENNEIMQNEDIMEEIVEVVPSKTEKAFTIALGVGVATLVGLTIYKKLIKPAIDKKKAAKEAANESTVADEE